jgi:hypothetical protein
MSTECTISRQGPRRVRARTAAPSAGWRERLIARCLDRAKNSRESLVSDARRRAALLRAWRSSDDPGLHGRAIDEADGNESFDDDSNCSLEGGRLETLPAPRVDRNHGDSDGLGISESELDVLVADLEAAIELERRREDEEFLVAAANELYVTSQADDDADVRELTNFESQLVLDASEMFVLCPCCEKSRLFVRCGTVFCGCGLRINGGSTDNITLDMVRSRLASLLEAHSLRDCRSKPVFSQKDVLSLGFNFLHVNCQSCDLDAIAF